MSRTLVAIALGALLACGTKHGGPPEIAYGRQLCAACGMIVSEPRHAAAIVLESGEALIFDDVGEALRRAASLPVSARREFYVHDYLDQSWLAAARAHFVRKSGLATPMGSGVIAFATENDARRFAEERSGSVLTFEEALNVS